MSADLIFRDAASPGDSDSNLQVRYENTISTPITSVAWRGDGRAIADSYELEMLSGSTCKVTANTKHPATTATETVVADGATANTDLVPGLDIVLNASSAVGWKASVSIGQLMDSSGNMTDRFAFGVVETDTTTSAMRIAVVNTGADPAQNSEVIALPGLRYSGSGATTLIDRIDNHSSDARDKMAAAADYTITWANWTDGTGDDAGYKVADIMVDGNLAVASARFDGSTVYEWGVAAYDDSGDYLSGMQIVLANTTSDPSSNTITLTVTDGYTWVEFAADVSGSPGSYSNSDLTVTEPGETAGTITASGTAYFWARLAMPSAAAIGAMRSINVKVRGLTT